uniref:Uncharacterized protein n=1 Tax=Romanomermis culicivorax TaxID=13658 RepID=A0A915K6J5_ROMCU
LRPIWLTIFKAENAWLVPSIRLEKVGQKNSIFLKMFEKNRLLSYPTTHEFGVYPPILQSIFGEVQIST